MLKCVSAKIKQRLEHARAEHPASEWQGKGIEWAFRAFLDEVYEARYELDTGRLHRLDDELLDAAATLIRILNKEYE